MLKKFIGGFVLLAFYVNGWCSALQDNGNGTVTDFATGLTWQQLDGDILRDWEEAQSYCASLALAGKTDWREPNIKELVSLVDFRVEYPSIDQVLFPSTEVDEPYWSATIYSDITTLAWVVFFDAGSNEIFTKATSSLYVRCVR